MATILSNPGSQVKAEPGRALADNQGRAPWLPRARRYSAVASSLAVGVSLRSSSFVRVAAYRNRITDTLFRAGKRAHAATRLAGPRAVPAVRAVVKRSVGTHTGRQVACIVGALVVVVAIDAVAVAKVFAGTRRGSHTS